MQDIEQEGEEIQVIPMADHLTATTAELKYQQMKELEKIVRGSMVKVLGHSDRALKQLQLQFHLQRG